MKEMEGRNERTRKDIEAKMKGLSDKVGRTSKLARMCKQVSALRERPVEGQAELESLKQKHLELIIADLEKDREQLKRQLDDTTECLDEERSLSESARKTHEDEQEDLRKRLRQQVKDLETRYLEEMRALSEENLRLQEAFDELQARFDAEVAASETERVSRE